MLLLVLTLVFSPVANGEGFLGEKTRSKRHSVDLKTRSDDLQEAMGAVLGCGGPPESNNLASSAIRSALRPIWLALPKNKYSEDRIDWPWLRYMANRYFMQKSSFLLRGLEPTRQVNASHQGAAEILSQQVPALVEMMLDGKSDEHGFSLEDAVALVATLEQLLFSSESSLLEQVYAGQRQSQQRALNFDELKRTLESYMVHWMIGNDPYAIRLLLNNRTLLEETLPQWQAISGMVEGTVKSMDFQRARAPKAGQVPLPRAGGYSFEDAHEAVGQIGKSFSSFWETECQDIKTSLSSMDKSGTGRVRLADFYGANMDGEWRFGESEAYLRELGALDESSPWRGKQVIIPNYLQAASNCIVSRPHYLVCCVNECESILSEVESFVGAPVAEPDDVLQLVGNMSSLDHKQDEQLVKMDAALRQQLMRVAEMHGGKVPLHGRLFAQWLHYVFPRECPFPHKAGTASTITPMEFGNHYYYASEGELSKHRGQVTEVNETEDLDWMSQWSEEEELPGDYASQLRAPWDGRRHGFLVGGGLFVAVAALVAAGVTGNNGGLSAAPVSSGFDYRKSHFV